jgi:hypothetical protein
MNRDPDKIKIKNFIKCYVIVGFRREIDENCALLDYYAVGSSNFWILYP